MFVLLIILATLFVENKTVSFRDNNLEIDHKILKEQYNATLRENMQMEKYVDVLWEQHVQLQHTLTTAMRLLDEKDEIIDNLTSQVQKMQRSIDQLTLSLEEFRVETESAMNERFEKIYSIFYVVVVIASVFVLLSAVYVTSSYVLRFIYNLYMNFSIRAAIAFPFLGMRSLILSVTGWWISWLSRNFMDPRPTAGMHEYVELESMVEGSRLQPVATFPSFQLDLQTFMAGKWKTIANASVLKVPGVGHIVVTVSHALFHSGDYRLYNANCPQARHLIISPEKFIMISEHDVAYLKITSNQQSLLQVKVARKPLSVLRDLPQIVSIIGMGYQTTSVLKIDDHTFGGLLYEGSTIAGFSGAPYHNHNTMYGMHMGSATVGLGIDIEYIETLIKRNEKVVLEASEDAVVEQIMKQFNEKKKKFKIRGNIVQFDGKYFDLDNVEEDIPDSFWEATTAVDYQGNIVQEALIEFNDIEDVPDSVKPAGDFRIVEDHGKKSPAVCAPKLFTPKPHQIKDESCQVAIPVSTDGHLLIVAQLKDLSRSTSLIETLLRSQRRNLKTIKAMSRMRPLRRYYGRGSTISTRRSI